MTTRISNQADGYQASSIDPLVTEPSQCKYTRGRRIGQALLLVAGLLSMPAVHAYSLVSFSTETANSIVTEGYKGDVERLYQEAELQQSDGAGVNPNPESRHLTHYEDAIIVSVGSSVYSDTDRDGFFTHFSISFDVDSSHGHRDIYARIWIRSDSNDWELFHTTGKYQIYGGLASDTFRVESKLLNNYPAAYYDLKLDILDPYNDQLLDSVDASTHTTLFALPLESTSLDDGGIRDQVVHEHVGAAITLPLLALGFLTSRIFSQRRRRLEHRPVSAVYSLPIRQRLLNKLRERQKHGARFSADIPKINR